MCANTELGEMLKFPNLIQHFVEHITNKTEHSLSFLGFMKNHYDSEKTHSDSDQHDEKLPFKTTNTNVNTIIAFEIQPEFSFKKPISFTSDKTVVLYKDFYKSSYSACIWLPPKLS